MKDDFLNGFMAAVQFVALDHGEDTIAEDMMVSTGYSKADFLRSQKGSGHGTDKMNPIIKEAFRREAVRVAREVPA